MPLLPILVCFRCFFFLSFLHFFISSRWAWIVCFHTSELSPPTSTQCVCRPPPPPPLRRWETILFHSYSSLALNGTREFIWLVHISPSPSSLRDFVVDRLNCFDIYLAMMYEAINYWNMPWRVSAAACCFRLGIAAGAYPQLDDDDDTITYPIRACRFASMWRRCIQCANFVLFALNTTVRTESEQKKKQNEEKNVHQSSRMRTFANFFSLPISLTGMLEAGCWIGDGIVAFICYRSISKFSCFAGTRRPNIINHLKVVLLNLVRLCLTVITLVFLAFCDTFRALCEWDASRTYYALTTWNE